MAVRRQAPRSTAAQETFSDPPSPRSSRQAVHDGIVETQVDGAEDDHRGGVGDPLDPLTLHAASAAVAQEQGDNRHESEDAVQECVHPVAFSTNRYCTRPLLLEECII